MNSACEPILSWFVILFLQMVLEVVLAGKREGRFVWSVHVALLLFTESECEQSTTHTTITSTKHANDIILLSA